MHSQYRNSHWSIKMVCALFIVGLVSCGGSEKQTAPSVYTEIPQDMVTTMPYSTLSPLTSAKCYGLFVDARNKDYFTIVRPGTINRSMVMYEFIVGEPITITATVLVFGEGGLVLNTHRNALRDYTITIVDRQGQSVPATDEGRRNSEAGSSSIGGIVVDQNGPRMQSFRIDKWFDLSNPGYYTLSLTRTVYVSGTPEEITGNPVTIHIVP